MTQPTATRGRGLLRRLVLGAAALPLVLATMVQLAPPAAAVEPVGGCWIWYAGFPQSDISRSLALWADPKAAPKGPADHVVKLSKGPQAGGTAMITYSYNKGPKNEGPPAPVTGTFRFSVNGGTVVEKSVAFGTISTDESIPGKTLKIPWTVEPGENRIVFEGVTFAASGFDVRIDCNGQKSGTSQKNPRTHPAPTNIEATTTSNGVAPYEPPPVAETPDILDGILPCIPLLLPCDEATDPEPEEPSGEEPTDPPAEEPTDDPSTEDPSGGEPPDGEGGASGTPAQGSVKYACVIHPFEADFDYDPEIVVHGSRGSGDTVDLLATMSDLPGIAPVPIDGSMDVTLNGTVDGKPATFTGSSHVTAQPSAAVPVPDLKGKVASSADSMPVVIDTLAFNFPDLSVSGDCEPVQGQDLGEMTLGSGGLPGGAGGGAAPPGSDTTTTPATTPTPPTTTVPDEVAQAAGAAAAGAQDLGVVDLRVEGGVGFGELFGGSPSRSLVLLVENRSAQTVEDPVVFVTVAKSGGSAEPQRIEMATGPLAPGEQRRLQMPVTLDGAGMGSYTITGQIGTTQAGAFSAPWGSYPWGLLTLLGAAALLAIVGAIRRFSPPLPQLATAAATVPGGQAPAAAAGSEDAVIDLDRLDAWFARGRLARRRPRRRLLGT